MTTPTSQRTPKPRARSVAVQADGVRAAVATRRLATLAERVLRALRVPRALLSVTLVDTRHMAMLNRRHLGHRGPTDVLTFALGDDLGGAIVADIYICPAVARAQAVAHGVGVREELARLVVHGTLHACGWDHPANDRTSSPMWRRQEQLLARYWPAQRTTT